MGIYHYLVCVDVATSVPLAIAGGTCFGVRVKAGFGFYDMHTGCPADLVARWLDAHESPPGHKWFVYADSHRLFLGDGTLVADGELESIWSVPNLAQDPSWTTRVLLRHRPRVVEVVAARLYE